MIAVDAIDCLYEPLSQYPFNGDMLPPSRLSVMDAFRVLDNRGHLRASHKVKRGVVLAAVTNHYSNIPSVLDSVRRGARVAYAAVSAWCSLRRHFFSVGLCLASAVVLA